MKTILFCLTILISASSKAHEETWLLDSRFVTADIHSILQTEYPELKANIASLYNQASYYSINPFLLAEIVKNTNANAINITAKKLFAEIRKKITSIHAKARLAAQKVMEKYNLSQKPNKATQSNMPALDVPFNHNQSWAFNGVHTWTGNDDGTPMSSLDLAKSWSIHWGGVTSDIWVAAAHGGIATVFSSCYIRITHASGWATDYYHLDNPIVHTGDTVVAGQFISNYANNLAQATCQGGRSSGPHVHFALVKDGARYALNNNKLSLWNVHAGRVSYDSDPTYMWLQRDRIKIHAYSGTINHKNGDNIIDYRYSGIYSASSINGHGLNIIISHKKDPDTQIIRNILFLTFYTYDDNGNANYYVGNRDFEQWRTDESKTLDLLQTSGGNFNQLQAIDFATDAVIAGSMTLQFIDCNHVAINFSLNEPTTGQTIVKDLLLTKALGLPDSVCNATSLSYN